MIYHKPQCQERDGPRIPACCSSSVAWGETRECQCPLMGFAVGRLRECGGNNNLLRWLSRSASQVLTDSEVRRSPLLVRELVLPEDKSKAYWPCFSKPLASSTSHPAEALAGTVKAGMDADVRHVCGKPTDAVYWNVPSVMCTVDVVLTPDLCYSLTWPSISRRAAVSTWFFYRLPAELGLNCSDAASAVSHTAVSERLSISIIYLYLYRLGGSKRISSIEQICRHTWLTYRRDGFNSFGVCSLPHLILACPRPRLPRQIAGLSFSLDVIRCPLIFYSCSHCIVTDVQTNCALCAVMGWYSLLSAQPLMEQQTGPADGYAPSAY